jgi:hypothetical protein
MWDRLFPGFKTVFPGGEQLQHQNGQISGMIGQAITMQRILRGMPVRR